MANKRARKVSRLLAANNRRPSTPWAFGEKRISKDGYVRIKTMTGIRGEHQVVMETKIKRELNLFEVPHHLNHIRSDNRPTNLVLESRYFHNILALNGD